MSPTNQRLARASLLRWALAFSLMIIACPVFAGEGPLTDLLPSPECGSGWVLEEKPVLYTKDTLFERINGESELFFPYGFSVLAAARYSKRDNPQTAIEADIYKMGSPLDAFGIYANYRRPEEEAVKIGVEGFVSPSQLMFYQDRYFVRMQASGVLELERDILAGCGRAISRNLPPAAGPPGELAAFMVPGVLGKMERYVAQSLLGYKFFRRGFIAEAVAGGDKFKIFVVPEDSPGAARAAFDRYRAYLKESGQEVLVADSSEEVSLAGLDPLYAKVTVVQAGRYLIGAVGYKDVSGVRPLLREMRFKLLRNPAG